MLMTSTRLNVHDAKTHLSKYLERVALGETILLCKRNKVVAEIRAVRPERLDPRPVGLAKGLFSIPPEFFDPLPDEILSHFTKNA